MMPRNGPDGAMNLSPASVSADAQGAGSQKGEVVATPRRRWLSGLLIGLAVVFSAIYIFVPFAFGAYAERARNELFGLCVPRDGGSDVVTGRSGQGRLTPQTAQASENRIGGLLE